MGIFKLLEDRCPLRRYKGRRQPALSHIPTACSVRVSSEGVVSLITTFPMTVSGDAHVIVAWMSARQPAPSAHPTVAERSS